MGWMKKKKRKKCLSHIYEVKVLKTPNSLLVGGGGGVPKTLSYPDTILNTLRYERVVSISLS